jgi:hypothetical protein
MTPHTAKGIQARSAAIGLINARSLIEARNVGIVYSAWAIIDKVAYTGVKSTEV